MRRILGFSTVAGTLVGGATGSVFTLYGIPAGLAVGAVLGLLGGCCTAGLVRFDEPDFTLPMARLVLAGPPLFLLVLAGAAAWLIGLVLVAAVSVAVAVPLTVIVTYGSAPWVVAPRRPDLAGANARTAMIRAILVPVGFVPLTTVAWVVTFGFLTSR
jgi:hypothetical protein